MPTGLIIALDYPDAHTAMSLVQQMDPAQCILKIGSALFTKAGTDFVTRLIDQHFRVFLDLKFHDIPSTVAKACRAAADMGVWMVNVHAVGGVSMMRAAQEALAGYKQRPLLTAVTVLTSFSEDTFHTLGYARTMQEQILYLAQLTRDAGLDGVVCSPFEVEDIKRFCGADFITVTPGIRLDHDHQDQVRVANVTQSKAWGSDYIVVGRAVTLAEQPQRVVQDILMRLS